MVSIEVYDTYAREQHKRLIKTAHTSRLLKNKENRLKSNNYNLLTLISRLQKRIPAFSRSASGKVKKEANPKSRIAMS